MPCFACGGASVGELLAVLPTTHLTLRGEKALLKAGVAVRAVMKPRRIDSDCGLALSLPPAAEEQARRALSAAGLVATFWGREGSPGAEGEWKPV